MRTFERPSYLEIVVVLSWFVVFFADSWLVALLVSHRPLAARALPKRVSAGALESAHHVKNMYFLLYLIYIALEH